MARGPPPLGLPTRRQRGRPPRVLAPLAPSLRPEAGSPSQSGTMQPRGPSVETPGRLLQKVRPRLMTICVAYVRPIMTSPAPYPPPILLRRPGWLAHPATLARTRGRWGRSERRRRSLGGAALPLGAPLAHAAPLRAGCLSCGPPQTAPLRVRAPARPTRPCAQRPTTRPRSSLPHVNLGPWPVLSHARRPCPVPHLLAPTRPDDLGPSR